MLNSAHQGESLHLGHGDHLCKGYYFCMSRPSWPSWRTPPRWQRRCRWGRRPRTIPGPMRNSRLSREITVFWQQKKIFQSDPPGSPPAVVTSTETAAVEQAFPTLQRWFPTPSELPRLYKTLNVLHLVCTTSHLYNTSFVQNLDIQHLICTKLIFTTPLLYNTLDTQHSDIQHLNLQF